MTGAVMNRFRGVRRRLAERYAFPDLVVVGREIPDVGECHLHRDGSSCAQCDGRHQHEWRRCVVLNKLGGFVGDATRCGICGARKCDNYGCQSRDATTRTPTSTPAGASRRSADEGGR